MSVLSSEFQCHASGCTIESRSIHSFFFDFAGIAGFTPADNSSTPRFFSIHFSFFFLRDSRSFDRGFFSLVHPDRKQGLPRVVGGVSCSGHPIRPQGVDTPRSCSSLPIQSLSPRLEHHHQSRALSVVSSSWMTPSKFDDTCHHCSTLKRSLSRSHHVVRFSLFGRALGPETGCRSSPARVSLSGSPLRFLLFRCVPCPVVLVIHCPFSFYFFLFLVFCPPAGFYCHAPK